MMLRAVTPLVALGWIGAIACGGYGGNTKLESTNPETIVGEVQLTGSDPAVMVTVRAEDGSWVNVIGGLRPEISNLSGVVIAVRGAPASGRDFEVEDYEIRSVQGERPAVGILVERGREVWLDGDTSVLLVGVPAGLRSRIGAKVWILGRPVDGGLQPQTYGIISRSESR